MRIYDLIAKKRDGGTHSREELEAIVNGFVSGEVADYQMAAWMMAVYLRGMTDEETAELTDVMAHSGVMVDLSPIPGIKVDKQARPPALRLFFTRGPSLPSCRQLEVTADGQGPKAQPLRAQGHRRYVPAARSDRDRA